jgi:hypothetical protein
LTIEQHFLETAHAHGMDDQTAKERAGELLRTVRLEPKRIVRHLKTAYNMTPEEYRERWGLSPDYPMVAPNYAKQRSRLAKQIGLGTRSRRGRQA